MLAHSETDLDLAREQSGVERAYDPRIFEGCPARGDIGEAQSFAVWLGRCVAMLLKATARPSSTSTMRPVTIPTDTA